MPMLCIDQRFERKKKLKFEAQNDKKKLQQKHYIATFTNSFTSSPVISNYWNATHNE